MIGKTWKTPWTVDFEIPAASTLPRHAPARFYPFTDPTVRLFCT